MSQVVRDANVYFLPATPAVPEKAVASPWHRLRTRVKQDVWRLRFAIAGFRLAMRRPRPPLFAGDDALAAYGFQRGELIERRPRLSPARVIDFHAARERLRPLPATR